MKDLNRKGSAAIMLLNGSPQKFLNLYMALFLAVRPRARVCRLRAVRIITELSFCSAATYGKQYLYIHFHSQ